MEQRIKLRVMGISYSPLQNGAFALLLAVEGRSTTHIPIVVGAPEAQSIAMFIENIKPPRPMTHELFGSFAHAFGIRLKSVLIYKFEDGIYSSEMTFDDGEREVRLDSRTSDAIAVALRAKAPIYTTPAIIEECGIEISREDIEAAAQTTGDDDSGDGTDAGFEDEETFADDTYDPVTDPTLDPALQAGLTVGELQRRIDFLTAHELYEEAAQTAKILAEKNGG